MAGAGVWRKAIREETYRRVGVFAKRRGEVLFCDKTETRETRIRRYADTFPPSWLEGFFDRAQRLAHRGVTEVALWDQCESRLRPNLGQYFEDG